ncbi:hypothetical protein [Streptomyces auratus]|uniref:Integral membrane protein n=1 Tax=Streptomyces auratus AGR0001 TaxID=1160718 RepID=J1ZV91_9ACTN|nr:hypothetical protein [Streptomyces auratus]QTZ92404.1 hypothetical protein SU9_013695 [Streptomyces auratus AGR0001]
MRSATVFLLLAALLGAAPATAAYAAPSNDSVSSVAYGQGGSGSHSASSGRYSDLGRAGVSKVFKSRRSSGTSRHSFGTGTGSHGKLTEWWEVILVLVVFLGFFGYVGYLGVKKVQGFFRRNA